MRKLLGKTHPRYQAYLLKTMVQYLRSQSLQLSFPGMKSFAWKSPVVIGSSNPLAVNHTIIYQALKDLFDGHSR